MRKTATIWLIVAAALVLTGGMIFGGVMSVLKWDFTKLSTAKYETNRYEINEMFNDISVETDTADVTFALSDDGKCRVECYEERKAKHAVGVEEDTLVIRIDNQKSWYDYIGIHFHSPKITVYLPEADYASLRINASTGGIDIPKDLHFVDVEIALSTGDVDFFASASEWIKIKTSTGDICVENSSAGSLDLSTSTGKVTMSGVTCEGDVTVGVSTGKAYLTDVACNRVTSSGNTGDVSLKNVIAAEKLSIQRSTGSIQLAGCDAAEIVIKTSTGDVTGSLLTEKIFVAEAGTGSVDVPKTAAGGRCEISTSTGDIRIEIEQ